MLYPLRIIILHFFFNVALDQVVVGTVIWVIALMWIILKVNACPIETQAPVFFPFFLIPVELVLRLYKSILERLFRMVVY